MEISKLRIKNYRSIKDSGDLELTKLFALVGQNNTGKSAVLKAVQIVWNKVKVKDTDFHKDTLEDIEIEITLKNFHSEKYKEFQNEEGVAEIKFVQPRNSEPKYLLNGEEVKATKIKKLPELLVISDIRNPQNESTGGKGSSLKDLIEQIEIHSEDANQKIDIEELKGKKLGDSTQEEIRKFLTHKRGEEIQKVSEEITNRFQEILANNDFALRISPTVEFSNDYNTMVYFPNSKAKIKNEVEILSCGTGLQSIFILALLEAYADVVQCSDSVFLVEEPEVYLHPKFQRKMFSALRDIASTNQVIYTTHSPIMISDIWANKSVRLTTLTDGETKISEIKIGDIVNELGIRYEDVLNAGIVIFVEGQTDIDFFRFIAEKLRPKIDNIDRIITFIFSDGFRNIHYFAFIQIITSQNVNAKFKIITDSDGEDHAIRKGKLLKDIESQFGNRSKEELEALVKRIDENVLILNQYSIESYFLDADFLNSVFTEIKKEDLVYMIDHYKKIYKECLDGVKGKETLQQFQSYCKPKNIFGNGEFKKKEKYEKFKEIFNNDKKFLETRDLLAKKCDDVKISGASLIDFFLADNRHTNKIFEEPTSIVQKILDETNSEDKN